MRRNKREGQKRRERDRRIEKRYIRTQLDNGTEREREIRRYHSIANEIK